MRLLTSRDRQAPMEVAMTDKLIDVKAELLRLPADHQDVADIVIPVGNGRSERTIDG